MDSYVPDEGESKHKTKELKQMARGYIQVPMTLADRNGIFHKAINDESKPDGVYLWAVAIKLYQYNNLAVHGGVDPNMMHLKHDSLFMHPVIYEELQLTREQFMIYINYLRVKGFLNSQPIEYTTTDIVGTGQIHYLRDGNSDIQVIRISIGRISDADEHHLIPPRRILTTEDLGPNAYIGTPNEFILLYLHIDIKVHRGKGDIDNTLRYYVSELISCSHLRLDQLKFIRRYTIKMLDTDRDGKARCGALIVIGSIKCISGVHV